MLINNELLAEYMNLNDEIKSRTRRLDEIKAALKEHGSIMTEEYVCMIEKQKRVGLPGLPEVLVKINRDTLETLGLIRETEVELVKVSRR